MTANDDILNASIRHMVWMERYKAGVVNKIIALMNRTTADLQKQLSNDLLDVEQRGYSLSKAATDRIVKMIADLTALRSAMYDVARTHTVMALEELAIYEADFQAGVIDNALYKNHFQISLDKPSASQLRSLVLSRPFQGRLLSDWFNGLEANDAKRLADAVRIGIAEGQTTAKIVQRVIGTRALNYRDGILETSRNEAWAVVSTAIQSTATHAADSLFQANSDIIKGVKWVAVLDNRTTPICQSRDGKIYPVNSGPRPPAHFRCRSRVVPFLGVTTVKGTRASMFGPVPEDTNYADWLKKQPDALQEEVLGVKKAKLFRDGGLTLDRFVDNAGHSYTLDQLRQRDTHAWHKAFPDG